MVRSRRSGLPVPRLLCLESGHQVYRVEGLLRAISGRSISIIPRIALASMNGKVPTSYNICQNPSESLGAAVVIEPVSADSLCKTGIFEDRAGDFRQFRPREGVIGDPETKSNARNAGIPGPVRRWLQTVAERRTEWLGREGSNSHIPFDVRSSEQQDCSG